MFCLVGYQRIYYWRVDAILKGRTFVKGNIWTFTTGKGRVWPVLEVIGKDKKKGKRKEKQNKPD